MTSKTNIPKVIGECIKGTKTNPSSRNKESRTDIVAASWHGNGQNSFLSRYAHHSLKTAPIIFVCFASDDFYLVIKKRFIFNPAKPDTRKGDISLICLYKVHKRK